MARRKNPENETKEQKKERKLKEQIANSPTRSEKVSWKRKLANLEKIYSKVEPIDEEILDLMAKRQPFLDEMAELRQEMADECIHPYDYLVVKDGYILCKFCNRKLKIIDA